MPVIRLTRSRTIGKGQGQELDNIISFQATFFWLNVSSFNIWRRLTRGFSRQKLCEDKKILRLVYPKVNSHFKFNFRFALYAHGMPLLICLLTLLVDELGGDIVKDMNKPNMGVYGCFLGYSTIGERPSFFETSLFLYFFLFVAIIVIANTVFLIMTLKFLKDGFGNKAKNLKSQGR